MLDEERTIDEIENRLTADEPIEKKDITSEVMATRALDALSGRIIIRGEYAKQIAEEFGLELKRGSSLREIRKLNSLRPEDTGYGITVGELCMRIVENLDDYESEDSHAAGAGFTQDRRKELNLPKIKSYVLS